MNQPIIALLVLYILAVQVSFRPVIAIVLSVSPSAVWYTSLDFVRSGLVAISHSSLRAFGLDGYKWSRSTTTYSPNTAINAYFLGFNIAGLNPSDNRDRWLGFPVRCLVILVYL